MASAGRAPRLRSGPAAWRPAGDPGLRPGAASPPPSRATPPWGLWVCPACWWPGAPCRPPRGTDRAVGVAWRRCGADRSDPDGALPTAVRTAATITASAIVVLQEILDGFSDFSHLALKKMIRGVDDHELFRFRELAVEPAHVFQRDELIELSMNQKCRLRRRNDEGVVVFVHGRGDADERGDT